MKLFTIVNFTIVYWLEMLWSWNSKLSFMLMVT